MSDTLQLRVSLSASPSTVYRALIGQEALQTWLAEHVDVSVADKRFAFWGPSVPQGDRGHQTLVSTSEDKSLRFRWTLDNTPTIVEISLESTDDNITTLHLGQDGLPTLEELMAPTGRRDGLHSMHTYWSLALANLAEYVEGRPLTPRADFRQDRANEIRVHIEIAASSDTVFDSLIDPTQIERWFGWEVELEPRISGRTTFGLEGEIFELEPGKKIAYADIEGAVARWEIEESEGTTYLTFTQTGYTNDEWDNAAQHESGWLGSLAELKRMHELGDRWSPLITELPDVSEDM